MNTLMQDNQSDQSPDNDSSSSHSSNTNVYDSAFFEADFLEFERGFQEVFHTFTGAPYSSLLPKKGAAEQLDDGVLDERA